MKLFASAAAAASILVLVLPAAQVVATTGEEPTRAEYAAEVEPICKRNTEANEKILKGVRAQVTHGQLKQAGARFVKASSALRGTVRQLRAVVQPPEDRETLGNWFGYLGEEAKLLGETGTKLRHGDKRGALRLSSSLIKVANKANAEVLDFPFRYCRSSPSKFV